MDRVQKEKVRPKPWREQLAEDPRLPSELPYGHAWARLIKLRYAYDDAGVPLIDPGHYDEIVKEAADWQVKYPGTRSDIILEKVRAALWIAHGRLEEPDLAPVDFG